MKGKLFAITSIAQNSGAKYFVTNLAHYIKKRDKRDEINVLIIDFDFNNPYLAHNYVKHDKVHGVDNLLNTINSGGLNDELFLDNVIETSLKFDVLKGTSLPEKKRMFTKEAIETILDKAVNIYDYVFAVIGNNPSDAGMVYTLMHAEEVFVVVRDNVTNTENAPKILAGIKSYYSASNPLMIIHNYRNTHSTSEFNSVLKDGEIYVAGSLIYDEKSIDNINLEKDKGFLSKSPNENEFMKIIKGKITLKESGSKGSKGSSRNTNNRNSNGKASSDRSNKGTNGGKSKRGIGNAPTPIVLEPEEKALEIKANDNDNLTVISLDKKD